MPRLCLDDPRQKVPLPSRHSSHGRTSFSLMQTPSLQLHPLAAPHASLMLWNERRTVRAMRSGSLAAHTALCAPSALLPPRRFVCPAPHSCGAARCIGPSSRFTAGPAPMTGAGQLPPDSSPLASSSPERTLSISLLSGRGQGTGAGKQKTAPRAGESRAHVYPLRNHVNLTLRSDPVRVASCAGTLRNNV